MCASKNAGRATENLLHVEITIKRSKLSNYMKKIQQLKRENQRGVSDNMLAFVAVIDTGSFAAAAAKLGLTPSAASKAVSRLEAQLATRLLYRTTRSVTLTEAGRIFLAHARSVLEAIEMASAELDALKTEPSGLVKVSVGSAYAKHQLVPRLPEFHRIYPKVKVALNVTDSIVDPTSGDIDLAIRPTGSPVPGLHVTMLTKAKRFLCASPVYLATHGSPLVPADLKNHNCLVMTGDLRFSRWPFHHVENRVEIEVSGSVTADNADMLLDLALAGHGIVRLLDTIVGPSLQRGELISIMEDTHIADSVRVDALCKLGRQILPRVQALVSFLKVH